MTSENDPIWCDECGRYMPWKHKPCPTTRARVTNAAIRCLKRVVEWIERVRDRGRSFPPTEVVLPPTQVELKPHPCPWNCVGRPWGGGVCAIDAHRVP